MSQLCCFDCVYFVPEDMLYNELQSEDRGESFPGECRRHAPVAGEPMKNGIRFNDTYWPTVLSDDWCGDFKQCPDRKVCNTCLRKAAS